MKKVSRSIISFLTLLTLIPPFTFASSKDLDEAVQSIAEQLTNDLNSANESIAIPPFLTFDNKTTALGKMLSEKLISKFAESKKITPVERDFIFKLTDEMKLGMTGLVEPKTVQQVGKFSGASYVLVGTIQKVGKDIQINSRLVRTETSQVEKSAETVLKETPDILNLLSQEIKTPLIPIPEESQQHKMLKVDFQGLRKDYEQLQDELKKLKVQIIQVKDEKSKIKINKKEKETQKALTAREYIAKGNISFNSGNYDSAVKYYSDAIGLYYAVDSEIDFSFLPDQPKELLESFFGRGVAYQKKGDYVRAIEDYTHAIRLNLDKESVWVYYNRGNAYLSRSQFRSAKRDFQKACNLGGVDACQALKKLQ